MVGIKDSYLIVAVGDGTSRDDPPADAEAGARVAAKGPADRDLRAPHRPDLYQPPAACARSARPPPIRAASSGSTCWGWRSRLGWSPPAGWLAPDVVTRTVLPIEGQPRGLLFPANGRGLKREDLAAIPDDATLALAARLNVQQTLDALAAAAKKADPEIKESLLKALGERSSAGGNADPPQDLFASLGDHWCFYNSPREGGLVMTGLTGVVPITDRKQFSRSYEVLKRLATQNLPLDDGFGRQRPADPPLSFCRRRRPLREPGRNRPGPGVVGGRQATRRGAGPAEHQGLSVAGQRQAGLWPTCRRWPPSFPAAIRCWRSAISMPRGSSSRSIRC